jgi:hypothetical protein
VNIASHRGTSSSKGTTIENKKLENKKLESVRQGDSKAKEDEKRSVEIFSEIFMVFDSLISFSS